MSVKQISILLLLFSTLLTIQSNPATSSDTAYDIMEAYDFPRGLLPKGISKYDIDTTTGRFHASWNDSCRFSLEGSYQLNYKSTISGYIAKDKLTGLTGVSVKVLFLWLNIVEVSRKGEDLEFSVGIASAKFPIENFYESPQCGCGLDCGKFNGGGDDRVVTRALRIDLTINYRVNARVPQSEEETIASIRKEPHLSIVLVGVRLILAIYVSTYL